MPVLCISILNALSTRSFRDRKRERERASERASERMCVSELFDMYRGASVYMYVGYIVEGYAWVHLPYDRFVCIVCVWERVYTYICVCLCVVYVYMYVCTYINITSCTHKLSCDLFVILSCDSILANLSHIFQVTLLHFCSRAGFSACACACVFVWGHLVVSDLSVGVSVWVWVCFYLDLCVCVCVCVCVHTHWFNAFVCSTSALCACHDLRTSRQKHQRFHLQTP